MTSHCMTLNVTQLRESILPLLQGVTKPLTGRRSQGKVVEGKDAGDSSSQSWQEKEEDPPDPRNASLPTYSSYLASEVARTGPNRTPTLCTKIAYTADTGNEELFARDAY